MTDFETFYEKFLKHGGIAHSPESKREASDLYEEINESCSRRPHGTPINVVNGACIAYHLGKRVGAQKEE